VVIRGSIDQIKEAKIAIEQQLQPIGIHVAGYSFNSKDELIERIRGIRDTIGEEFLQGEDLFLMFALLLAHPEAPRKMKGGVVSMRYGVHPEFDDTKSFLINKKDGTVDGFSFKKCVDQMLSKIPRQRAAPAMLQQMKNGTILKVTSEGLETEGKANVREWKQFFMAYGKVQYVEIDTRQGVALVRYEDAKGAKLAKEEISEINEQQAEVVILSGAEEKAYWEKLWEYQRAAALREDSGKGKGKGKGKGSKGKGKGGKGKGKGRRNRGDSFSDGGREKRQRHD